MVVLNRPLIGLESYETAKELENLAVKTDKRKDFETAVVLYELACERYSASNHQEEAVRCDKRAEELADLISE